MWINLIGRLVMAVGATIIGVAAAREALALGDEAVNAGWEGRDPNVNIMGRLTGN